MCGQRLNEECLEYDGDVSVFRGEPFSGTAFLEYPDGAPRRETPYKDGFEHGICREWHPNGQLQREWTAIHGRAEGQVTEWHANGQTRSIGVYEKGVELSFAEWDETGALVIKREIDPSSTQFAYLQKSRQEN